MTIRVEGGGGLSLEFDPLRGAKITSISAHGIEWLAQNDVGVTPAAGAAFTDAEMAGWDECAPSIVACTVEGFTIPDHGDLWDTPFTISGNVVSAQGRSYPYKFERDAEPTATGVRLNYRATATESRIPFLWAAHPQFAAPPGTRVELLGVETVIDVQSSGTPEVDWGGAIATIDSLADGQSRKVYVTPGHPTFAARLVRREAALDLRWSRECPYLGVWFDHRAFSREPVIAVEPTTGYYDSLATASNCGRVPVIDVGRPLTWWVEVSVSQ